MDIDLLAAIPLFARLDRTELGDLAQLLQLEKFAPNAPIVWIGDKGNSFYIVKLGRAVVTQPNEQGKDVTLATLVPGNFFGEISLLDGGPRTATVRADTDVEVFSLDRDAFVKFIEAHPAAAVHILTILGQRQRDLMTKLRDIRNVNEAEDERQTRLQRFLARVAAVGASEAFLLANLLFFGIWILYNTSHHNRPVALHDEPPTFFFLGFMITVEAIVLSMLVLGSQKRQAERDKLRADLDYQINVKAHLEVMSLHQKVDELRKLLEQQPPAR